MNRKSGILLYLAFFLSFCVGTGKAAWLITSSSKDYSNAQLAQGNVEGDKVVCYIDKDTSENQYTSIEVALAKAKSTSGSQTVYVKLGLNSTIKIRRDCEIGSGDTLCLPYEGTTIHSYVNGGGHDVAYEHGTRTTYIEVSSGVNFTNNGTLTIGAIQNSGNGGTSPNGNAADKYTEIKLLGNSRLINNGAIDCYGYISGNGTSSKIVCNPNSTVNRPFTVIEHRGGSRFAGRAGKDKSEIESVVNSSVSTSGNKQGTGKPVCFVFNRWYMDGFLNLNFEFAFGAKLIGKAALFADGENNATDMKIIDSDGLMQLSSNSFLSGRFDSKTKKINLNSYGSWKLGNLDVSFAIKKTKKVIFTITAWIKIKIPSSSVFLPIPYYFNVTLNPFKNGQSAIVDATSQSFKLMPGSSLTVKQNVTLNGNKIAIYGQNDLYPNGESVETGDLGSSKYPNLQDAVLKNYGNINSSALGGNIQNYNGTITSSLNSVESKEAHDFASNSITIKFVISQSVNIYIPKYDPSINLGLKITELKS